MKVPCRGCDDRHTGCHAECEKYLSWSNERREARERDYASRIADIYAVERDKKIKSYKLKNRSRGKRR
jgi:hypothetical protein